MKKYIRLEEIRAKPMTRGEYNKYRGWKIPEDENPNDEGYLVEDLDSPISNHSSHDNFISWSPKSVFDKAYRETDGLNFGLALEALKGGKKIARKGWNIEGMFLFLLPEKAVFDKKFVGEAVWGPQSIRMSTKNDKGNQLVFSDWLPLQPDLFAEDWFILE